MKTLLRSALLVLSIALTACVNCTGLASQEVRSIQDNKQSTVLVSVPLQGTGSGFSVGNGYFITNAHVVGFQKKATLSANYKDFYTAKVVHVDYAKDLALMYCDGLKHLKGVIMRKTPLKLGDRVYAIGHPFRLPALVSYGRVSRIENKHIITDCPINSGNSGGPMFDITGRLVGVNRAIYTPRTGDWIGISLSISVKDVEEFVEKCFSTKQK